MIRKGFYNCGHCKKWPFFTIASAKTDASIQNIFRFAPIGQFGAIQTVAQSLGVDLTPVGVRDADEIEHGITAFARSPDVGLIVTADWRLVAM